MAERRASALGFLWARHRWAVLGLGLAMVIAAGFAVRLVVFTIYWSDPAHRDLPVEGWMTPGYIAHSHGLDPLDLRESLGLAPGRTTLAEIAARRGVPVETVVAEVEAALAAAREGAE
jgi:hypothetical protein